MKYFLLVLLLVIPGCRALTSPDPEPAILAIDHMSSSYEEVIETFKSVITKSSGLSDEDKIEIISRLENFNNDRKETEDFLFRYIKSAGQISSKGIIDILIKYKELRR